MISTKGRYALIAMVDIASNTLNDGVVSIKDISRRTNISGKYLEQVINILVKAKLLRSLRGSNGGYSLCKSRREYTAYEILSATEGELTPLFNIEVSSPTYSFWKKYDDMVTAYLKSITLDNLVEESRARDYMDFSI